MHKFDDKEKLLEECVKRVRMASVCVSVYIYTIDI